MNLLSSMTRSALCRSLFGTVYFSPTVADVDFYNQYTTQSFYLSMALQPRTPLRDLPIEQFVTSAAHKRSLSPSRSALYNPAKRRILDAEGIPISSGLGNRSHSSRPTLSPLYGAQFATPYRPLRRGDMHIQRNSGDSSSTRFTKSGSNAGMSPASPSRATTTPLASRLPQLWDPHTSLPPRSQQFTIDRQSKHYPGFDVYHDHRITPPVAVESLSDNGMAVEDDKSEGEGCKENVPPKRKTKKISHRSRLSLGDPTCSRLSGSPHKGDATGLHTTCFPAPR